MCNFVTSLHVCCFVLQHNIQLHWVITSTNYMQYEYKYHAILRQLVIFVWKKTCWLCMLYFCIFFTFPPSQKVPKVFVCILTHLTGPSKYHTTCKTSHQYYTLEYVIKHIFSCILFYTQINVVQCSFRVKKKLFVLSQWIRIFMSSAMFVRLDIQNLFNYWIGDLK